MIHIRPRRIARASLAVCVLLAAGCSSSGARTPTPSTLWATSTTTVQVSIAANTAVDVQNGYGGAERFCAQSPLNGTISYDGKSGTVHIILAVGGLPPDNDILLDWLNNTVRGYTIAAFRTDTKGNSVQGTLRIFRPGETRGYQIMLAKADLAGTSLGRFDPCAAVACSAADTTTVNGRAVPMATGGWLALANASGLHEPLTRDASGALLPVKLLWLVKAPSGTPVSLSARGENGNSIPWLTDATGQRVDPLDERTQPQTAPGSSPEWSDIPSLLLAPGPGCYEVRTKISGVDQSLTLSVE